MKKIIFIIAAISAILAGCSKSEVMTSTVNEHAIEFNPYTGKAPISKATVATTETLELEGFKVYAFLHPANGANYSGEPYMDKVVTKPEDAEKWEYDGTAYWPVNNLLDFVAYGLNAQDEFDDASKFITENSTKTAITYVVPETVADQKDLLVAVPQPDLAHGGSSKTVQLHFDHMLSRVAFSLVTMAGNNIPVTITKLQLRGQFYTQGDVDLTAAAPAITQDEPKAVIYDLLTPNGNFTDEADAVGVQIYDNSMLYKLTGVVDGNYENPEYAKNEDATPADEATAAANALNSYMMLIPTVPADGSVAAPLATVDITYFLPQAGYYDVSVPLIAKDENDTPFNIGFAPGKAYNFKFKVSTNGISFSVGIDNWDGSGASQEFELS